MRFEFLEWFVKDLGFAAEMKPCVPNDPVPDLGPCDVLIAQEFFEHVHDPVFYLDELDPHLKPGGFLIAAVGDHEDEFMHVSPDLGPLRRRLLELGYEHVVPDHVMQKTR
jgi:hypothetical protein